MERNLENEPLPGGADEPGREAALLARDFMRQIHAEPDLRLIDRLCRMAVTGEPGRDRAAMAALYGTIVEGLCDDFSEQGVKVCNRVLLRILDFVRHTAPGREVQTALQKLGCSDPGALLARHEGVRSIRPLPLSVRQRVRSAVVLSRVSAGADVVITSIIVQRLLAALPAAELFLVGPRHLQEIFAALSRVRFLPIAYDRRGPLPGRLTVWPEILRLMEQEIPAPEPDSLLVFDPDTRLTQLGLLPLASDKQTFYFSSRTNPLAGGEPTLPELTNHWLDLVLAETASRPPAVFLDQRLLEEAEDLFRRLRAHGARQVYVANFGVGGNPRKRIPGDFEEELLAAVLEAASRTIILLDSGGDSEEKERIRTLLAAMEARGVATDFLTEGDLGRQPARLAQGLIGFQGSLGALGALIHQADGFLGYDSSGQHLAGALGTPAIIFFVGAPNPRFLVRWRSASPSVVTIPVEAAGEMKPRALRDLLLTAIASLRQVHRAGNERRGGE